MLCSTIEEIGFGLQTPRIQPPRIQPPTNEFPELCACPHVRAGFTWLLLRPLLDKLLRKFSFMQHGVSYSHTFGFMCLIRDRDDLLLLYSFASDIVY